jgi:hypothetical protein
MVSRQAAADMSQRRTLAGAGRGEMISSTVRVVASPDMVAVWPLG